MTDLTKNKDTVVAFYDTMFNQSNPRGGGAEFRIAFADASSR